MRFAGIARLNHKIPPIAIQTRTIDHVIGFVAIWIDLPEIGHQPVFVLTYEQISICHRKELASHSFSGAESFTNRCQEIVLVVFNAQDVFVGPCVAVCNCFAPRCQADEFG